jgi:hypothetical protein
MQRRLHAVKSRPDTYPSNWREIAATIVGPEAMAYADPDQMPKQHRFTFEQACKNGQEEAA